METKQRTIRTSEVILFILMVLFAIFFYNQCGITRVLKDDKQSQEEFLKDELSYYKNELGQEVAKRKSLQGSVSNLDFLLSKYIDSTGQLNILVDNYERIATAGNVGQTTQFDTIEVPYEVVVDCEFHREFSKKTDYYELLGVSNQNGLTINSLTIPNIMSFAIGEKKTGWFKPNEYVVEVVNSNPHVKTTGLDTYTFTPKIKRWGIGAQFGYGLSSNFTIAPYVGIGVSYDFLRF